MSQPLEEEAFNEELDLPDAELTEEEQVSPYADLDVNDDASLQDPEAADVDE